MMYDVQLIAVATEAGVSIVQIITRAPLSAFSRDAAFANSFIVSEDGQSWELMGALSDEGIELELARLGKTDVLSWQRITPADLPADRANRNAWEIA